MKKLSALTVSLIAVLAINNSAFAEGLATGEWVNKYFVDFTAHDWPDAAGGAGDIVTNVYGVIDPSDPTKNTVRQEKMGVTDGLDNTTTVLKAKTDGTNVYINTNKQITADLGVIPVPNYEFNGNNATVQVPDTLSFDTQSEDVTITVNSTVDASDIKATGTVRDENTTYETDKPEFEDIAKGLCAGNGAAVNGRCMKVYMGGSTQEEATYNPSTATAQLAAHTDQVQDVLTNIADANNETVQIAVLQKDDFANISVSGDGTANVVTGGTVNIDTTRDETVTIAGTITGVDESKTVLVPHN